MFVNFTLIKLHIVKGKNQHAEILPSADFQHLPSVVVLKIGLGLKTTFLGSWSCLGIGSIFTRSCLGLGLGGLGLTLIKTTAFCPCLTDKE